MLGDTQNRSMFASLPEATELCIAENVATAITGHGFFESIIPMQVIESRLQAPSWYNLDDSRC
jgi:hypothetical protein